MVQVSTKMFILEHQVMDSFQTNNHLNVELELAQIGVLPLTLEFVNKILKNPLLIKNYF